MLSIEEAIAIVKKSYPSGEIFSWIEYQNLYLFKIFNNLPGEQEMDPFFSVDTVTGEFKEFAILTDGNISEIVPAFAAKEARGGLHDSG